METPVPIGVVIHVHLCRCRPSPACTLTPLKAGSSWSRIPALQASGAVGAPENAVGLVFSFPLTPFLIWLFSMGREERGLSCQQLWGCAHSLQHPSLLHYLLPGQVPEWTKCTSREKRKEKVEKPFYSDSEGESGPTESADSGEGSICRDVRAQASPVSCSEAAPPPWQWEQIHSFLAWPAPSARALLFHGHSPNPLAMQLEAVSASLCPG